ncbi:MAG: ApbE family protein [Candidatus Marinimicrobia bacterium]|jgi:uncharacterized protein|nr:ApbE family protein [Candidatus Neomarinimicrobiota bacterium]MBT3618490.1 ApbE family protein [Candidatus Neomarinimicrobiota bacterium]MBT3828896.1 ApbE family protein [Candidatus Neomarinimicrobiota bacterium]MBT3997280.1 ApbE family protein [Candidatus Neomarinimicrobiota bacterium]MBT4281198.1 ApbE family protein [Candidatus Neomarinimicrobiota bacterium]
MDLIIGLLIFAIAIFGLSIGIIFNNKPLSGSCGGNADGSCTTCGGDTEKCDSIQSDNPTP